MPRWLRKPPGARQRQRLNRKRARWPRVLRRLHRSRLRSRSNRLWSKSICRRRHRSRNSARHPLLQRRSRGLLRWHRSRQLLSRWLLSLRRPPRNLPGSRRHKLHLHPRPPSCARALRRRLRRPSYRPLLRRPSALTRQAPLHLRPDRSLVLPGHRRRSRCRSLTSRRRLSQARRSARLRGLLRRPRQNNCRARIKRSCRGICVPM